MCVDVSHVAGVEVGFAQAQLHRAGRPEPGRVRLCDVVRVGGDACAGGLGVHLGPAGLGVLRGLQHHDGRTLAEHEPVAALVPRTGRGLGVVVAPGERHHLAEGRHRQRVYGGFGATAHHHVGAAEPDQIDPHRDRLVAGRAGRDGRVHPGLGPEREADVGGGGVGHQHRDRQWRDPTRPLLQECVVVGQQRLHAADPGGHRHREPLRIHPGVSQSGIGPGLVGGDQRELARTVQPPGLDPVQDLGGLDRDLGRDPGAELLGPVLGERSDAGPPLEEGGPGGGHVSADRGRGPQAGDDDSLGRHEVPLLGGGLGRPTWGLPRAVSPGRAR